MMTRLSLFSSHLLLPLVTLTSTLVHALRFDPEQIEHNLNTNRTATNPLDYWGQRPASHTYFPSPANWRAPYYTVFLDRFVNGDPSNDNINGTLFETDSMTTQLRNGGDLQGLIDSLDYIAGMGIKVGGPRGIRTKGPREMCQAHRDLYSRSSTLPVRPSSTNRGGPTLIRYDPATPTCAMLVVPKTNQSPPSLST